MRLFQKLSVTKQKQKYREMFETQKSGNKTSSGEIQAVAGLNKENKCKSGKGQDQVSGGVSTSCKCSMETSRN